MARGRFGKYGETKRLQRLRASGSRASGLPRPPQGPSPHAAPHPGFLRIVVREALPDENLFLERLSGRAFAPYGSYADVIRNWFDSGEAVTLIALAEGRPAGFAMAARIHAEPGSNGGTELLAIAVHAGQRRAGIGRALLRRIEEETRRGGAGVMWLHTAVSNRAARCLFEDEGYRIVRLRQVFYPRGQDALLMAKRLPGEAP